jgi:hypothetical protein
MKRLLLILCFLSSFYIAKSNCPDHIAVAETNNCHNFQFSIPFSGENQIIHWSFDGSVPVGGGHSISHEFVENGDHQVCVTYSSSHCTEGVELCETVHVSCAEDETDCPDHIAVAETNNCHNFQFSIPVSGENQIIHWSFDGSVPVGGGHSISHEFVENGDHQVCVTYSSSHCTEGIEICETLHVSCAEDETDCPDHIAVAETNNCHNFQFSIPVSGENQIIHWSFDGSVPVGGGHSISHEFVENGDHQVCVTYSSSHCTEGIEICETVHVSCAEDETDCPDHIAVAETNNCHNFQFSIPVSGENQIIHWSFDGSVPVGGGHSISHEFVENGDHQVCVTYSSSHCTEGIEICETVHVSCAEDETDCPDHIAVAETNNCHNFQFSIPVSGENQIIHWSFDGSVPVGGGHSISMNSSRMAIIRFALHTAAHIAPKA